MSARDLRQPAPNGRLFLAESPSASSTEDVHAQLQRERQRADALEAAVTAYGVAMIAVEKDGRILYATAPALALLSGSRGITLQDGRLVAARASDDAQLQALLRMEEPGQIGAPAARPSRNSNSSRAVAGDAQGVEGVRLHAVASAPPLHLSVMRLPGRPAVVFLHDALSQLPSRGTLLRSLYSITPSQARLVDLLLNGSSVREAADTMGIAEETARFHLKSVFRTTGTGNQSALLRMMLGLPGDLQS